MKQKSLIAIGGVEAGADLRIDAIDGACEEEAVRQALEDERALVRNCYPPLGRGPKRSGR